MDIVDVIIFVLSLCLAGASIFGGVYYIQQNDAWKKSLGVMFFLVAVVFLFSAGRGGIYLWKKFRSSTANSEQARLAANAATRQAIENAARLRAAAESARAAANTRAVIQPNASNAPQVAVPIRPLQ